MLTIDCREYLKEIKTEMSKEFAELKEKFNVTPALVIIQVGDSPESNKYVSNKIKHIKDCGADAILVKMPNSVMTDELCRVVRTYNTLSSIHGIIVQQPLPSHVDTLTVLDTIKPEKDIDCLTTVNMGLLLRGVPYVQPCTPRGIIEILDRNNVKLEGANVLVIGRSEIVGKPLQIMITERNATVVLAHSKSNIFTKEGFIDGSKYDIVISAIGKGHYVKVNDMRDGVLIDVGINFTDEGKMIGDIDLDECYNTNGIVTPVPFGVGTMTCAMVIKNLRDITLKQIKKAIPVGLAELNKRK